jgi:hypothetical protein
MAEIGSDLVTPFTIKEMTGPKRTLTLKSRALPYRPFTLEGEQRNQTEWYPGSPEATLQVYGSKENETTINGMWKDRFLNAQIGVNSVATLLAFASETVDGEEVSSANESALPTARRLADAVDQIRRAGQKVEVTWLNHVRHGLLSKFTQKWHTGHDVEWEITFVWTSQGETLKDILMKDSTATNIGDLPNKVGTEVTSLFKDLQNLSENILGAFNTISGRIADFTDALTDTVAAIGDIISTPAEAMRRVAGILDGLKLSADDLIGIMQDKADGASLDSAGSALRDSLERTFGDLLNLRGSHHDKVAAAKRLRDLCSREQQALLNSINGPQLAVFQARAGQDLRTVALEAYGDADAWRGLMVYNNMSTGELRAGQVVFVPAQPPSDGC